jgi:peptidoglycan lytic transglycosylase
VPSDSRISLLAVVAACLSVVAVAADTLGGTAAGGTAAAGDAPLKSHLDRSGRTRVGKASFYAKQLAGKTMADGTPMHAHGDNAASKTLPLGTTAKVTNLETGKSAVVVIRDRGPYVNGRIVDLSPATAQKIGITKEAGIAKVEVAPIAVPLADGHLKVGSAAWDMDIHDMPGDWDN